jgi:hypothetical protein
VPFFTAKPTQSSTMRLGKPCSTTVGTLGKARNALWTDHALIRSIHLINAHSQLRRCREPLFPGATCGLGAISTSSDRR